MGETNQGTALTHTDVVPRETHLERPHRASMFEMDPEQQITYASKIATSLCKVIDKQHLYTDLGGKKHVRVEGWQVLGTFLGVLSKERIVTEHADGSYEAFVDLVRVSDGVTIGGASSICGMDEKRWGKADKYARRSMAVTRATGKAYRTNFSWIVSLAGYEVTPAEEMPYIEAPKASIYTGSTEQQQKVQKILEGENVPHERWDDIHNAMMGKPSTELYNVIRTVRSN